MAVKSQVEIKQGSEGGWLGFSSPPWTVLTYTTYFTLPSDEHGTIRWRL